MTSFIKAIGHKMGQLFNKIVRHRDTETETSSASEKLDQKIVQNLSSGRFPSTGQFKYLGKILTNREQTIIRIVSIIVVVSVFLLGFRFIQRHIENVPRAGGEYIEALVGSPSRINPLYSVANDVDQDLSTLIYSGLFKQSGTYGLQPDLAESYELSEDEKTYTITIRQDALWHDGAPVTINDVLFTIESIQNPEYQSPLSVNFSGITIEPVDKKTFKLILPEPFAPFVSTLTFGILPVHLWGDVPPLNVGLVEYNIKPIGSGPYVFEKLTRDRLGNVKNYDLVKNQSYYSTKPYIERLIFRFYPDFTSAIQAVKNNKVNGISYVPEEYKEELNKARGVDLLRLNLPQYTAIFFNQKRNNVLSEANVRRALAYATDKAGIINEVLLGDGEPVNGPILPGMLGFNPEMHTYPYNPERAKELLEEIDWTMPEEGEVRTKDDKEMTIKITTSQRPAYEQVLEILTRNWAEIGVKVEADIVDSNRIQSEVIKTREYDALLYGEIVGYDPDPYPFWHSSQQKDPGLNLAIFYSKKSDKALEVARQSNSEEERSLKYKEFQNILAEEVPALFLYQPIYTYGLGSKVKGFPTTFIEVPSDRFTDIENWYTKTKKTWR
ncbi:MAG: ABC transporter substrate-binding protein [Patescibacteria group bacterium]